VANPENSRYVVALTGGVASGKSAVARRFEALGIRVHDADAAARVVVEPGEPALAEIEFAFGTQVLDANGALDRRALRELIFADAAARRKLESIVHPRVHAWLLRRVALDGGPYSLLMIPLLAETWPQYAFVDRVLLVDAPEEAQIERLAKRDGVTREQAQRTLEAQATRAQRRAIAQDMILNDGDESALDAQVAALHSRYLQLAAIKRERTR
jgi:dephospho-CoA kinase